MRPQRLICPRLQVIYRSSSPPRWTRVLTGSVGSRPLCVWRDHDFSSRTTCAPLPPRARAQSRIAYLSRCLHLGPSWCCFTFCTPWSRLIHRQSSFEFRSNHLNLDASHQSGLCPDVDVYDHPFRKFSAVVDFVRSSSGWLFHKWGYVWPSMYNHKSTRPFDSLM